MKRHMITGTLAICLLASAVAAGGCSGKSTGKKAEIPETAAETETVSEETSAEQEIDPETMDFIKYNIYVELNNYMIEVLDNLDHYYAVVEYADDFALVPDSGYDYKFGINYLNTDIIDDAFAVSSMEPAYENLDELTQKIAEPMRALMEGFNNINKSYDFADNQYAKAKEYHAQIQDNAEAFGDVVYEFMAEVDAIGNERMAAEEQKMLDEGRLIIYNCSHAITIGNQILDECYAQGVSDYNITELDLTNIKVLYEELLETVAAYDAAVSDSNQIMKESLSNSTPFDGLLNSLSQSVEWLIRQVESGKPIEDPGSEYLGGIIHVQVVLSQCIERYNSVFVE